MCKLLAMHPELGCHEKTNVESGDYVRLQVRTKFNVYLRNYHSVLNASTFEIPLLQEATKGILGTLTGVFSCKGTIKLGTLGS